jgi:hypothetical protein
MTAFTTVLFLVVISGIVVILAALYLRKKGASIWAPVLILIFGIAGLLMVPLLVPVKTERIEIIDYVLVRSSESVILDLDNFKYAKYDRFHAFDSYKAVTEINDSTKFYLIRDKTFYQAPISSYNAWSNPPYDQYNTK